MREYPQGRVVGIPEDVTTCGFAIVSSTSAARLREETRPGADPGRYH